MSDGIDWLPIHQRLKEGSMWRLWAVAEGLTKTLSAIFQKLVGVVMGTLEMGCIAAAIIGFLQMLLGFTGYAATHRTTRSRLVPDFQSVLLMIFLGFLAGIFGTVLSIYTFTLGADLAIRTLFISSSVVPASIAAAFLWPKTDGLDVRQIVGITIFLAAMWAMLDFPDLSLLRGLEPWVWLTLVLAAVNALGELVTRATAVKFDVWVNNLWIGGSTDVFSMPGRGLFLGIKGGAGIDSTHAFVWGTLAIGVLVAEMASFRSLAYRGGGAIALRKIIMPGVYLISEMLAGIWLYGEPMTMGKLVGVLMWFVAIYFVDRKASEDLALLFARKRVV